MTPSHDDPLTLQLPARDFYWSVTDASSLPPCEPHRMSAGVRAALDERFQQELPFSIDDLAVAYTPASSGAIVACALPIAALQAAIATHPQILSLTPLEVPAELACAADPRQLNVLTGLFEPLAIRRARHRRTLASLSFGALALLVLTIGVARRAEHLRSSAAALDVSISESASQGSGLRTNAEISLRALEAERDRLILTRTAGAQRTLPMDVAHSASAVLAAWPPDLEIQTHTFSATSQGITIAAEMKDQASAQTLAKSLGSIPGWNLRVPRMQSTGKAIRFDASLQRAGGGT